MTEDGHADTLRGTESSAEGALKTRQLSTNILPSWLFHRELWRPRSVEKDRTASPVAAEGQTPRNCLDPPQMPRPEIEKGRCEGSVSNASPSLRGFPQDSLLSHTLDLFSRVLGSGSGGRLRMGLLTLWVRSCCSPRAEPQGRCPFPKSPSPLAPQGPCQRDLRGR